MASISAGGHVQPPPPSPPGHDPRTSSIQALRMRAKEHVESITKGLQMVWRLTEDTPRARTAASLTLVTAWRASEQSFAQRHSRSRGVAGVARTVSTDETEKVRSVTEGENHRRYWTWRKYKKLGKRKRRSSVCVCWRVNLIEKEYWYQPLLPMDECIVHCWRVKLKRLILQQSTIGGYIFDDYRDYRCDNWQVPMINHQACVHGWKWASYWSQSCENDVINLGNWVFIWNIMRKV